jgi:hypothetical protein
VQKDRLKNFPENIKEIWLFSEAKFSRLVKWQSVRFQKTICFDVVMSKHQIVENARNNVQLEKDRTYGKRKSFIAYTQRFKNEEKQEERMN